MPASVLQKSCLTLTLNMIPIKMAGYVISCGMSFSLKSVMQMAINVLAKTSMPKPYQPAPNDLMMNIKQTAVKASTKG